MLDRISLPWLVTAEIIIWAVLCCLINGPAVLGYIALHVATTGLFLLFLRHTLRRAQQVQRVST